MDTNVLILYDRKTSQIEALALALAEGVRQIEGAQAIIRPIAEAKQEDLISAHGILLGSPNWSGLTGTLKEWLDQQGDPWEEGTLAGKVGAAFASGRGRHSGLEFTLLSLLHWMLACGMVIIGLPWSNTMRWSGSYYGATAAGEVTPLDLEQARLLGRRVASLASALKNVKG